MNEESVEAVSKAFKKCDLDVSMWDMNTLRELARIAIKAYGEFWYVPRHGNVLDLHRAQVPQYDTAKVRRGKEKMKFDEKQRISAVDILMKLGLI